MNKALDIIYIIITITWSILLCYGMIRDFYEKFIK